MASTTKLMTAYLARRTLRLAQVVRAAPYQPGPAESLMGLRPGVTVSVEDLLYGLLLASGNDAAVTLAVASKGSEDLFVAAMNRAARNLDLEDTRYENPIGFDAPGHHTSARDLVDLAIELRRDPVLREIVDRPHATVEIGAQERRIFTRNKLVLSHMYVDGVKSGYTDRAGYVLVASAERKGVTLVSALLGAPSETERDRGTLALLRHGFSLYSSQVVLERAERMGVVGVEDRAVTVPVVPAGRVALTVRRDQRVSVESQGLPAEVEGPVARGDRLGTAVVRVDGTREARMPLVASRGAEAASLIERIDGALPGRRLGAWGLLAFAALGLVTALTLLAFLVRRRGGSR